MTVAPKLPDAIQWHEGMLLAPQHFQQMSSRMDDLLHYQMEAGLPFHWGIKSLTIDTVLLIEGTFRVLEIEAVMPDGLVAYHSPATEGNLEIDLTPHTDEMAQAPITIYLVVPAKKEGQVSARGTLARYNSVEGRPVIDENTGESELSIPRLVPRLSLLITDKPPQKYTALPLARASYKNETYALTDYLAPCLNVPLRSPVGRMCSAISRRLREKAVFLAERISSPAAALRGPMSLETKLLIHAMVSGLPEFEALLSSGRAHPYRLYLSLCAILGNLSVLGTGLVPPVLAPYNHDDLYANFAETRDYIFRVIDEGILESHTAIPFDFENGVFSIRLIRAWTTPTIVIGVRGRTAMREEEITAWFEESLISSDVNVESLKEKRIRGADREKIEGDAELVPTRGVTLYAVNTDAEFIVPDKKFQVFNTSDPMNKRGPAELILYVRNKT
jgi:type VI secretion system protein ImpJ